VIYTYNKYIQFIIYNNQNGIECKSVVNKEQCNKMEGKNILYGCLWLEGKKISDEPCINKVYISLILL
jgi:hypothetical protein